MIELKIHDSELDAGFAHRLFDHLLNFRVNRQHQTAPLLRRDVPAFRAVQLPIARVHLPQIAARGGAHYKVYKKDSDTETNSHIRRLTDEERVEEIAHMLSGATLTEAALSNAKALLARN